MHFNQHGSTSRLNSERGQMAIFIALIFQVLFVFFAMIVNVGLIVHDKINLQNSVDLAAYYAAQRQAEMLNAIAHQNYEIRQAWKLLSWRIRVLGDLGYREHPMQLETGNLFQDVSAFKGGVSNGILARSNWLPTVCINHGIWGNKQNLCYESKIKIPELPTVRTINPFFPANFGITIATGILKDIAKADCKKTGPINFNLALRWARAYRNQIAKSKEIIRLYAGELSKGPSDFRDIRNDSAKDGARKTLMYNLTRANNKSLTEENLRFFNSLGIEGKSDSWLHEIPIYPLIYYTDLIEQSGSGCTGQAKPIGGRGQENKPYHGEAITENDNFFRNEPPQVTDLFHSVYGVEKNPWMMAYVGVYAETKPRKPYLPFGEPITLRAKAFAKPFGGRIGPWYYKTWPQGSNRSAGNDQQKVDMLAPLPLNPSGQFDEISPSVLELGIPNYSRFPGDKLGLVSKAALALFKETITRRVQQDDYLRPEYYSGTPSEEDGLAMVAEVSGAFTGLNRPLGMLGLNSSR